MIGQSVAEQVIPSLLPVADASSKRIIVVGAGPVGVRFAEELLHYMPQAEVLLFGNEPYKPYNRVQLSAFLAGDIGRDELDIDLPDVDASHLNFIISAIHQIDTDTRTVTTAEGDQYPYDKLVIATGARAHIPNVPGNHLKGVYCFRKLADAESLYARVYSARHIVIVGGGLLGCEAAKALCRYNTQVTLVQQGERLMNKQLDDEAAGRLQAKIEALGVRVITQDGVRHIHGEARVTGVDTRTGEHIVCDTVLFCAGITPNIELARNAQLRVATGIVVSDQLRTSDPHIYAIGECCEHQGRTYGLVNPGFEQAAVAANSIAGQTAIYPGSLSVSRLKVVGESVCSIGEVVDLLKRTRQREITFQDAERGIYRKLVLHRGKLIGALGIGPWPEMNRVQEAFMAGRTIRVWQRLLFRTSGRLWNSEQAADVTAWPDHTIVCQCNAIDRGKLSHAMEQGCETVEALQKCTKAGTVCGSCKPLLEQLCNQDGPRTKEIAWLPVLAGSIGAVVLALLIALLPEVSVSTSVQTQSWFEGIWNDKFYKQVTGFTLLGLTVIGLLMSLRKRLRLERLGEFAYWRLLHIILGALCTGILIFHTGFHLGDNLNRLLIVDFLGVLLLGSTAGLIVALSHKLSSTRSMKLRKFWSWVHILFAWPLPALLSIHILTVYYF